VVCYSSVFELVFWAHERFVMLNAATNHFAVSVGSCDHITRVTGMIV